MRARSLSLTFAVAVVFSLALAASAQSATYCVGADASCSGNPANAFPMSTSGFSDAVTAANANTADSFDKIEVGAGTIDINSTITAESGAGNRLFIEGVGNGNSNFHFTQSAGPGLVINADGYLNDSLTNVNVKLDGVPSSTRQAIVLHGGALRGVNFDVSSSSVIVSYGVLMTDGAKCTYCDFKLSGSSASGVYAPGDATIDSSKFSDASGAVDDTRGVVSGAPATVTIRASKFIELYRPVLFDSGTVSVFDSVIDMGDHVGAQGVYVSNDNASQATLVANLDGVTIVGAASNQRAVFVDAETDKPAGESATANIKNSAFMLTGGSSSEVRCIDDGGFGVGTLNMDYNYSRSSTPSNSGCDVTKTHPTDSDSAGPSDLFVNWDEGDLRPKKDSPLIDIGDPLADTSSRPVDAIGGLRVVDGLKSGSVRIDAGGIEYTDYAPDKPSVSASATDVEVGVPVNFTANSIDVNGDEVTYAWDFKDGSTSSEQNPTHSFSAPGTYVVEAQAHAGGSPSEVGTATITVRAKSDCCSAGAGYTNLFVYNKPSGPFKFKKGAKLKNGFALSAKKPKGASIKVNVTGGPVEVVLTLATKKGKKLKGTQKVTFPLGRSYMTFGGKWNRKKLTTGGYTLLGQRLIDIGTNTSPSRLSMNVTMPKKTG